MLKNKVLRIEWEFVCLQNMKGHLELTSIGFGRCHETDEAGWKLVGLRTSVDVGSLSMRRPLNSCCKQQIAPGCSQLGSSGHMTFEEVAKQSTTHHKPFNPSWDHD